MSSDAVQQVLAQIDYLQKQWLGLQVNLAPERREKIDRKVRLEWNTYSNNIEGNTYTLGETEDLLFHGKKAEGKTPQEHRDITGHDNAITRVRRMVEDHYEFSEQSIRELHRVLMNGEYEIEEKTSEGQKVLVRLQPGEYKTKPNVVRVGNMEKLYALPAEVPARMNAFVQSYRQEKGHRTKHPLVLASELHHEFTAIHPFPDGNGRMARLLTNWILLSEGYPPFILLLKEREAYVAALRAVDNSTTEIFQLVRLFGNSLSTWLDLHCRAARGEDIEDMTDLDKEIALLKQEVADRPEPEAFTPETLKKCFEHSVFPLLTRLCLRLSEFDEFFAESKVNLNASVFMQLPNYVSPTWNDFAGSLPKNELVAALRKYLQGGIRNRLHVGFYWTGFKKGGTYDFTKHVNLVFNFEPYKYRVEFEGGVVRKRWERWYQNELGEEAIREIVDLIRRPFVDEIREAIRRSTS